MKNFGLSELYLVAPQRAINKRAFALASHAGDVLEGAVYCDSLAQAVTGCKLVLGTTARPRASDQRVYSSREAAGTFPADEVGVAFGPEDFGLSNEDLGPLSGVYPDSYLGLRLAQTSRRQCRSWRMSGL